MKAIFLNTLVCWNGCCFWQNFRVQIILYENGGHTMLFFISVCAVSVLVFLHFSLPTVLYPFSLQQCHVYYKFYYLSRYVVFNIICLNGWSWASFHNFCGKEKGRKQNLEQGYFHVNVGDVNGREGKMQVNWKGCEKMKGVGESWLQLLPSPAACLVAVSAGGRYQESNWSN